VITVDLAAFGVFPSHGFLPSADPLTKLPEYHKPWEDIIRHLTKLLMSVGVRTWLLAVASRQVAERLGRPPVLSYGSHVFPGHERFTEHRLRLRDYMPPLHREFVETLEQNGG
jgi:hypothetical protein